MHPFKTLLLMSAVCLLPSFALAAPSALSDAQKAAVEETVRELLVNKEPEIVIKAAQAIQKKMEKEQSSKGQEAILKYKDKINNDPNSFVAGNPKGDITVVEFFDYQCGYCKQAQATVMKLLEEDKNVRFIFKELPILGPASEEASKAALASVAQGKYLQFHNALMTAKERLSSDGIMKIAQEVGLDVEKLKKDMQSEKVAKIIADNQSLSADLGARGTPAFIIADKLYPGAIPLEQMKDLIDQARKAKK